MSNFNTRQLNEEESLSQSSDEKMDTGSESFRSQDTPNSVLSSDFDDKSESHVLRLQNPENGVLRLSEPESNDNIPTNITDNFVKNMSDLNIDAPARPKDLSISPPKTTSLVLTTSHPLMGSPDFPDVVPKKITRDERDLSLSSIEDERPPETNGFGMYSPNTNNSKNNLYFSENFSTAESQVLSEGKLDNAPPDVARVVTPRRKIKPIFVATPPIQGALRVDNTPHSLLGPVVDNRDESAIYSVYAEGVKMKLSHQSTPKTALDDDDSDIDVRVAQWCQSTHTRSGPNFDLPMELSTNVALNNAVQSPDVLSSSSQEERSAFEALLDPASGRAALRPRAPATLRHTLSPNTLRRKITVPPEEEDRCSLDSVSAMDSEEEPPGIEDDPLPEPDTGAHSDDETKSHKRSQSTATYSECSDPIPEYSAAEEFHNERSYISVNIGDTHATCDMKVIEPYKRVISHGGYDAQGSAIIVFSACHLPDTGRIDYRYVHRHLFLYVMWTLERLIGEEYVLVYLHGSAGPRKMPSFRWLHECYQLIDRRLRKSLKHLYLVHPTFWLKSFVFFTKPFVSSKFFRKLTYVQDLEQLFSLVPVQPAAIPDVVKQYDQAR